MSQSTTIIPADETLELSDFVPLADFVSANPNVWRTMKSARWSVHNRTRNGLDEFGVLSKRNGRIHIITPRIARWMAAGILK